MSWESVETARCARCRIYAPRAELVLGPDGDVYCCGVPAEAYRVAEEWVVRRREPAPLERATRVVIAAMLAITLAFPLAACCSQL